MTEFTIEPDGYVTEIAAGPPEPSELQIMFAPMTDARAEIEAG